MSHFAVLVIGDNVEGQLAPYDENTEVDPYKKYVETSHDAWPRSLAVKDGVDPGDDEGVAAWAKAHWPDDEEERYEVDDIGLYSWSTYNPQSKWDWYKVGGRWTGHLILKHGRDGDLGSPGLMTPHAKPGTADVARKGDVDFDAMKMEAAVEAGDRFDRYAALLAKHGPALAWDDVEAPTIEERRAVYWAQPLVDALSKQNLLPWGGKGIGEYEVGREAYVAEAARQAPTTYAMVAEGAWKARNEMGWFGMDRGEEDPRWLDFWWRMVDGLPDDALLTIVDCHI